MLHTPLTSDNPTPSQSRVAAYVNGLRPEWQRWLRLHLFTSFSKAKNWTELNKKLQIHGFYLQQSGAFIWLRDCHSQVKICTTNTLGFPPYQLEDRFGVLAN